MSKWLLRGLVFAALMVIARLFQGALINAYQTQALSISIPLMVLFGLAAFIWGFGDGRADARANPDPDHRRDLAIVWLLTGLFAGIVSGFVSWFVAMFYDNIYTGGLFAELTTFASFTALVTFVAAIVGVAVGRYLIDRKAPPVQRRSADSDRADTDVFAAVNEDDASQTESSQAEPVADRETT